LVTRGDLRFRRFVEHAARGDDATYGGEQGDGDHHDHPPLERDQDRMLAETVCLSCRTVFQVAHVASLMVVIIAASVYR
jgi:hypothetical protein